MRSFEMAQRVLIILLVYCTSVFCEQCITENFEHGLSEFSSDNFLCAGFSAFRLGNYSSLEIAGSNPKSAVYISPDENVSCVSTNLLPMVAGAVIEFNVYVEGLKMTDFITIIVSQEDVSGVIVAKKSVYASEPNIIDGWVVLTITLEDGLEDFNGYISFMGTVSEDATILIDSFRYLEPGYDAQLCQIYEINPALISETTPSPVETSTIAVETTTLPVETTTLPVETTTLPVETTTLPVETTTLPVETTTLPVETTTLPVETTTLPVETTTLPVETTTLPVETTSAVETTTLPVETTTLQVETTTLAAEEITVETTTLLVETTTLPVETTPLSVETTTFAAEETTSAVETTRLLEETTEPLVETTTLPVETTTLAAEETTLVGEETTLASEKTTSAVETPISSLETTTPSIETTLSPNPTTHVTTDEESQCLTYNFETDFDILFSNEQDVCSGFEIWNMEHYNYTSTDRPNGESGTFIYPKEDLSCISSFLFPMEIRGIVELNVYMESKSEIVSSEQISVMVMEKIEDGIDVVTGTAGVSSLDTNYYDGWRTIRIQLFGTGSFNGYVTLFGSASENSTVLVDSFRYIPPTYDERLCYIYDSDAPVDTTVQPIIESCVSYTIAQDFDNRFTSSKPICNGFAAWNLKTYQSTAVAVPNEDSEYFISANGNSNCVSSFPFAMSPEGVIQVKVYMEAMDPMIDHIIVLAKKTTGDDAQDTVNGYEMQTPSNYGYEDGWQLLNVTLTDFDSFIGYVTFFGAAAEGSTVLIDSFKYIPPYEEC